MFDTIVARCSAPGAAYRGVVRLSGPGVLQALAMLCGQDFFVPSASGENGEECPQSVFSVTLKLFSSPLPARIFYWKDGTGYTGQESLEIHTFGSPPLLDAVVQKIIATKNARLAEPGEFTQRAFLAGRLDLMQAEAVLGVIEAQNPAMLQAALTQLGGGMPAPLKQYRKRLADALMNLEASFEFPEEDIEFISVTTIKDIVHDALNAVEEFRAKILRRMFSREKPSVVLFGPPNAGKSTLFNLLTGQDRAIVSPLTGTTRDYLEADVNLGGILCILIDTAGVNDRDFIRDEEEHRLPFTDDIAVQAEAFSHENKRRADVLIHCRDNGKPDEREWKVEDGEWNVWRKDDAAVCAALSQHVTAFLARRNVSEMVEGTALRCKGAVETADESLRWAEQLCASDWDESLLAAELRRAVNALGLLDGTVAADDILAQIFSRFCIGK